MSRLVRVVCWSATLFLVASTLVVVAGVEPAGAAPVTVTFNYNGTDGRDGSKQVFTVPAGVTELTIRALGAQGGGCDGGGLGGETTASVGVTPGQVLDIYVGGRPEFATGTTGGFNGGGDALCGGGGASDVRTTGPSATRIVVAGGGGGMGIGSTGGNAAGGTGGGVQGGNGAGQSYLATAHAEGGGGGTQTSGGPGGGHPGCAGGNSVGENGGPGGSGDGGAGALVQLTLDAGGYGGGGGGGWFGGGGGAACASDFIEDVGLAGGGGGGSGFPSQVSGVAPPGHGLVSITYAAGFVARPVARPGRVSAGDLGSCAVLADGRARCWGRNDFGQLGNGQVTDSPVPVAVSGLSNVVGIDTGASHSCAVLGNGSVRCWGRNNFGQLGNGQTANSSTPVTVSGISNAVAVSASSALHSCAVLSNGTVKCWGRNRVGQLGNNATSTGATSIPVVVSGLTGAVSVSVGGEHSCSVLSSGAVKCWGDNSSGQLGNNSNVNAKVPVTVSGLSTAVAVSAGSAAHNCAVLADGTARCWGYNTEGELGNNTLVGSKVPVVVSGLAGAVAIAAGGGHSCATLSNGTAKCWGRNDEGQLGNNNAPTDAKTPVVVSGLTNAVAISGGGFHSCATLASGTAKCWGYNGNGGLGNNNATWPTSPIPVTVSSVSGMDSGVPISAGQVGSCAVLGNGRARCWGRNDFGQLGNGQVTDSPVPVAVSGLSNVVGIDTGASHSCAVLGNGSVRCWGRNNFGQLGNGQTANSSTPVTVSGISNAVAVSASSALHSCAVLSNGTVKCWGRNRVGQLGNNATSTGATSIPVVVSGLTGAVSVSVGGEHSCSVLSSGAVKCWGDNSSGQLGNNSNVNAKVPVTVSGLSTAVAVSAGSAAHNCAVLADGTARCWGYNTEGELGNNTLVGSKVPVVVSGLAGAVAIAAGGGHSCATLSNGTAKCWGRNDEGQLGNNNAPTDAKTPVVVSGLTNAVAISGGGFHSCATLASGTAKCWGYNGNGGLGNNNATYPTSPIPVFARLSY